jgi:hypothetical protein
LLSAWLLPGPFLQAQWPGGPHTFRRTECVSLHSGVNQGITGISDASAGPFSVLSPHHPLFGLAAAGGDAVEATTSSAWLPSLSAPRCADARWIALDRNASRGSLLLSQKFTVNTCDFSGASIRFWFAADDVLGNDSLGQVGVYLNGNPLPGFAGGGYAVETELEQADIGALLLKGCNTLEVFVRDLHGAPCAVMYCATICYRVCRKEKVVTIRSGNGPGPLDSVITVLRVHPAGGISPSDLEAACHSAFAWIIPPRAGWCWNPGTPTDQLAGWIRHGPPTQPSQAALFCHSFELDVCDELLGASVHFEFAVRDWLGSGPSGVPNVGIWLNGNPVKGSVQNGAGGTQCFEFDGVIPGCDLMVGKNTVHFWAEDFQTLDPAIMYSAKLRVFSCAPPERIFFCSDESVRMRPQGDYSAPLPGSGSGGVFVWPGDFACPNAVALITNRPPPWCPTPVPARFPCEANWIGADADGSPGSMLFCQTFNVANPRKGCIGRAWLQLYFAVDDRLGDGGAGPNVAGIYINGQPVPNTSVAGAGGSLCLELKREIGSLLCPGPNTFSFYCRDTLANESGAIWAGVITIERCDPYSFGFDVGRGCPYTDLSLDVTPFQLGGIGTFELGPIQPSSIGFLLFGFARQPVPIPLSVIGMHDCFLLVDAARSLTGMANASSTAPFSLPIPNHPNLLGVEVFGQGVAFAPGANYLGLLMSNGLGVVIEP